MNDLSVKVMIGAAWAFGVLNLAPDLMAMFVDRGLVPTIPGLSANWTEFVYVVGLALLGPLVLLLIDRRRRRLEWKEFDR